MFRAIVDLDATSSHNPALAHRIALDRAGGYCRRAGAVLGLAMLKDQYGLNEMTVSLFALLGVIILIVVLVSCLTYSLGKIELTEDGVTITNFKTLFVSVRATTAWNQMEDVTVRGNGVLNSLTGTGTIYIQSAGTEPNFSLSWIGEPYELQAFIAAQAEASNPNA